MGHRSDPSFLVLHVVRIRGRATTDHIGAIVGDASLAVQLLDDAARAGHVVHRDGRAPGWSLTAEGRAAHAALLAADRSACAADAAVHAAYERFLEVNQPFIELCTRWQVRPDGSLNDHADAGYDTGVIAELDGIDAAAQPICADVATVLDRFGPYTTRLSGALHRLRAGDTPWFTSPAVDSYHTVWFELHEDLLQTIGIERTAER